MTSLNSFVIVDGTDNFVINATKNLDNTLSQFNFSLKG